MDRYPDLDDLLEILRRASLNVERSEDEERFSQILTQIAKERDAIIELAIQNGLHDELHAMIC